MSYDTKKHRKDGKPYGSEPEDYNSSYSYDQVHHLCDGDSAVLTEVLRRSRALTATEYARFNEADNTIHLFLAIQDGSSDLIQITLKRLLIMSFLAVPDEDIPEPLRPRGVFPLDPDVHLTD